MYIFICIYLVSIPCAPLSLFSHKKKCEKKMCLDLNTHTHTLFYIYIYIYIYLYILTLSLVCARSLSLCTRAGSLCAASCSFTRRTRFLHYYFTTHTASCTALSCLLTHTPCTRLRSLCAPSYYTPRQQHYYFTTRARARSVSHNTHLLGDSSLQLLLYILLY